jgi:phage tail tape-measure protein
MFTSLFGGVKVNSKEVQDYVDKKCGGYVTTYTETKKKIDELKTSVNNGLAENDTDLANAMALLDSLAALGDPKDLTKSQLEQYKAIVQQLKTDWPELAKYIGKDGLFKQDTDAIKEHIKELEREKRLEFLLNKIPQAVENNEQAKKDWLERRQAILDEMALLKKKKEEQAAANELQDRVNTISNSTYYAI